MGRPKKYFTEEERKVAKREYQKRYRQDNPEKVKERKKRWREENPDYQKEYNKHYYQENTEKMLEHNKEYLKQYRKTPIGRACYLVSNYQTEDNKYNRGECTLTSQWILENIFTKPCRYCRKEGWKKIGCDRINNDLPHTEDNVIPCCDECNVKRGTKTYEEFLMSLSGINKSVS